MAVPHHQVSMTAEQSAAFESWLTHLRANYAAPPETWARVHILAKINDPDIHMLLALAFSDGYAQGEFAGVHDA